MYLNTAIHYINQFSYFTFFYSVHHCSEEEVVEEEDDGNDRRESETLYVT